MGCITKTSVFFSVALVSLLIVFFVVLAQWTEGIEKRSSSASSGSNFRGGLNPSDTSNTNSSQAETSTSICLVSLIDIEEDEEEVQIKKSNSDKYNDDDEMLVCNRVSAKAENGVEDHFFFVKNLDDKTVRSNQVALMKNEWFIEYSHDWVESGQRHTATIVIPPDSDVETIEPSRVPHHHSISPSHRRQLTSSLEERRRKLFSTLGKRVVVVVAVDLAGTTKQQLHNHVFGSSNSLKSQMADCSQGQVTIVPHPEYPVIEVSPPMDPSKYSFVELYSTILNDIKKELDLKNGESITSTADHLLLVVPDDINRRPGELGWGSTPGFFSGIIESLAPSTMTMLHEIGHNFGLGHAYEQGVAYSDMSTVMGYSHRDVVKMCYNGHNMWEMGWFEDRSYDIRFSDDNKNDREIVNVAFYGDYKKTTSAEPVIVRYEDIYLTFNRKRGMNEETKEYGDMLLVVKEMPGEHHAHTDLITALGVGNNAFQMKFDDNSNGNNNIFIEVCSYTSGDYLDPEYLTVSVGKKAGGCPHQSVATTSSSNGGGQGNRSTETVVSQQLEPEPLECKMMWPWVELLSPIASDSAAMDVDYVLCEMVASDPERYCEQTDNTSQQEVWKICRLQCPQSGCVENSMGVNLDTGARRTNGNGEVTHQVDDEDEETMCEDLFSWVEVEIEDEYGNKEYTKKTCEELGVGFLQTREFFCNKYDTLTHVPVFEICRAGCPGSGCSQ